jgi:zinc transport system ATP-binding protein
MSENPPAIEFDNVSVTLGGVRILESVSASVPGGSATAIIGPNGAGKTTLLLAMLGQIPHRGRIVFGPGNGRPRLGYVPQRLDFDRGMPITVLDAMSLWQRRPLLLGRCRRARESAKAMLARVGGEHLLNRRLGALSGGELQRVMLALAVSQQPDILILDEPSAGVDIAGGNLLCELLESLRTERGFTQIMVTHDLSVVTAHATHVICLNRRVTGQGPTQQTLSSAVLGETFGVHLGLAHLHLVGDEVRAKHSCRENHEHD